MRPQITPSGPLAITAGRHPLLEALLHHRHCAAAPRPQGWAAPAPGSAAADGAGGAPSAAEAAGGGQFAAPVAYAANDTYVSEAATLHLITGPNMAGKSTYLKQARGRGQGEFGAGGGGVERLPTHCVCASHQRFGAPRKRPRRS